MDKLPAELILNILEDVCTGDTPKHQIISCVMQVCRLWHQYITSSPNIWKDISIRRDTPDGFVQRSLLNSKSADLNIALECSQVDWPWCDEFPPFQIATDYLCRESPRWISYSVKTREFTPAATSLPINVPNLRRLELHNSDPHKCRCRLMPAMPSLKFLSVGGFPLDWSKLQAPQLQELTVTQADLQSDSLWQFLVDADANTTLRKLTIEGLGPDQLRHLRNPIHIPQLTDLQLPTIYSSSQISAFRVPNLLHLTVGRPARYTQWEWKPVELAFRRLQEAKMLEMCTSTSGLHDLLHAMPNIRRLHLLQSDLVGARHHAGERVLQERIWPHLEELTIHGISGMKELQKVVQIHHDTIKAVHIHCLDLGLGQKTSASEWEAHGDALAWLQSNVPEFGIDHSVDVFGSGYRSLEDAMAGRRKACRGATCATDGPGGWWH